MHRSFRMPPTFDLLPPTHQAASIRPSQSSSVRLPIDVDAGMLDNPRNCQMTLTSLDPLHISRQEHFHSFLDDCEQNCRGKDDGKKLCSYPGREFSKLEIIGSGAEGLVLKCEVPQGGDPVALKLVIGGRGSIQRTLTASSSLKPQNVLHGLRRTRHFTTHHVRANWHAIQAQQKPHLAFRVYPIRMIALEHGPGGIVE
jgi:hypothetical protein